MIMTVWKKRTLLLLCIITVHVTASNQNRKEKTSQYTGVSWSKDNNLWKANINLVGHQHYGGSFDDELDAAKRVNQMCDEYGISHKNSGISANPNPQHRTKETSQYKGVCWDNQCKKWKATIIVLKKQKFCANFIDELDAAKRVNQKCDEYGICHKNPGIGANPNQQTCRNTYKKTSQYIGVFWYSQNKNWRASITVLKQQKYCGNFIDELDAAKKVNLKCDECGIPHKNPGIGANPKPKVT